MTAQAVERPVMTNGHLFHSPQGLYPFQGDAVANAILRENMVMPIDLGLGKTVIFVALICHLIEMGEIDLAIVVARKNKLDPTEFPKDFRNFTTLRTHLYSGDGRPKRLAKALAEGLDVVMMTYETGRADLMKRVKDPKKPKALGRATDGPLMEQLDLRNKRVLWIFDEVIKLGSRGTGTYRSFEYAINQGRRTNKQRVIGLHANSMATGFDQSFNIGRIVAPWMMPSVKEFEDRFTYGKDSYQRYNFRREASTEFGPLFQQLIYRKRATDPDVTPYYPKLLQKLVPVDLEPSHRALYDAVGALYGDDWDDLSDERLGQLRAALRLTLGHPAAHLHADGELSKAIVGIMGEESLRAIPSTKTKKLIDMCKEITEGEEQVLVFTFFAETVFPEVVRDMREAGFELATYSAQQSEAANEANKAAFKSGHAKVLISTDAGAEGLNLPEATYIIQYEPSHTWDRWTQRFGRGTRIGSTTSFIYGRTMVCRNTLDVAQVRKVLRRNEWQDSLLGDLGQLGHVSAKTRKQQLMNGVDL